METSGISRPTADNSAYWPPRYTGSGSDMQRALAIAVLVTLAASPISRVVCGWSCAHVGKEAASGQCHEQRSAEPALKIGVDHCEGSGLPVALTAKITDGLTAPSLDIASVQPFPNSQLQSWTSSPSGDSGTAPPSNRLIPLRI